MKFVIPGVPLAKARHRTARRGNMLMQYDPQEAEKKNISWVLTEQVRNAFNNLDKSIAMQASKFAFAASLCVEMTFYMPLPTSMSKSSLNRFLWGFGNYQSHSNKPDIDNLCKFFCDAANGIIFHDDKQIVDIRASKRYSMNPRTEIIVKPKKTLDIHDKADEILSLLSPSDFHDLMEITYELSCYAQKFNADGYSEDVDNSEEYHRKQLTEAACLMSELSERFGSVFATIKKKHPDFYVNIDEVRERKENLQKNQFHIGKTLS